MVSDEPWPIAAYQAFCSAAPNPALPDGGLFTAGDICDNGSDTATIDWFVRRSTDGGATWTTQDIVDSGAGGKAQCRAIQVAPSGDIYAAGLTGTNQGVGGWVWLVRKSSDGGSTWSTVDSVWDSNVKEARAVGFHPNGSILVAGTIGNVWTVRRSTNGGATWATVDSYQTGRQLPSEAFGVVVDSSGNIYVAGTARASLKGKYTDQWVVRRSTNGGGTWATVDNFTLDYTGYLAALSGPSGITIAPSGAVFVCGYLTATDGSLHWIVRQETPGSKGAISGLPPMIIRWSPDSPLRPMGSPATLTVLSLSPAEPLMQQEPTTGSPADGEPIGKIATALKTLCCGSKNRWCRRCRRFCLCGGWLRWRRPHRGRFSRESRGDGVQLLPSPIARSFRGPKKRNCEACHEMMRHNLQQPPFREAGLPKSGAELFFSPHFSSFET